VLLSGKHLKDQW